MSTSHVLVVDDEGDIRALIDEILSEEGYQVTVAADAAEARTARSNDKFDLVLLDIWMPDTDGISLLREWSDPGDLDCPVVMMSGHGTVDTAVEATRRANGKGPTHHIAHSMLVYPDDVERFNFERSNMVTEISPYQLWVPDPAIVPWVNMIGRDRFNLTMTPLKTLVDAGAVVTYGSDWDNIPEPDPWFAMEGMVTRRYPGKPEYGQLNPDERIDVETAIEIFTRNGAVAMEAESETGSIEPGKSADFIVISENLLKIRPQEIHKIKVLKTVFRGHTVYQAE